MTDTNTAKLDPVRRNGRALILRTFSSKAREIISAQPYTKRIGPVLLVSEMNREAAVEALTAGGICVETPSRHP